MQPGAQVHVDLLVDVEGVGLQEAAGTRDTGAVHQHVDLQPVERGGDGGGVGDVERERDDAVAFARIFNNPLEAVAGGIAARRAPSVRLSPASTNIVIDTLKRAESDFSYRDQKASGERAIVVRLYQSVAAHEKASLQL